MKLHQLLIFLVALFLTACGTFKAGIAPAVTASTSVSVFPSSSLGGSLSFRKSCIEPNWSLISDARAWGRRSQQIISPNGNLVAYVDDSENKIYITNSNGVVITKIPDHSGILSNLAWSPDSSHFAFAVLALSGPAFGGALYVVGVDGTGPTLLANYNGLDDTIAWSPAGRQIAFTNAYLCRSCECQGKSPLVYTADGTRCGEPEGELVSEPEANLKCLGSPSHTTGPCFYQIQVVNIDGSTRPEFVDYGCKPVWQ